MQLRSIEIPCMSEDNWIGDQVNQRMDTKQLKNVLEIIFLLGQITLTNVLYVSTCVPPDCCTHVADLSHIYLIPHPDIDPIYTLFMLYLSVI